VARYEYQASEGFTSFVFESKGKRGNILKRVDFEWLGDVEIAGERIGYAVYNLAFGDVDPLTNEMDDLAVSDNGDMEKVLGTVAYIMHDFLVKYPQVIVQFAGSTRSRTRLYRMLISKWMGYLEDGFEIMGSFQGVWEGFIRGRDFEALLIKRKTVPLGG
jgi:hypothetical protein